MELTNKGTDFMKEIGAALVGIGAVEGIAPEGFRRAVVCAVAVPLDIVRKIPEGPTPDYPEKYETMNKYMDMIAVKGAEFISSLGYRSIPLVGSNVKINREKMMSEFPYKTAATRAGLGWVGKNDLLITPQFGPGIRLTVVLTDAPLKAAVPINESGCGSCSACVDICPGKAISGKLWYAGINREELVNIELCMKGAAQVAEKTLGKPSGLCGKCFAVCPYTQKYLNSAQ